MSADNERIVRFRQTVEMISVHHSPSACQFRQPIVQGGGPKAPSFPYLDRWKPIYAILEGALEIVVANAQHIKKVPGRKTDVKDAEWISDLLCHGRCGLDAGRGDHR